METARANRRPGLGGHRLVAGGLGLAALVVVVLVVFASTGSQVTDPLAQAATLSSGTPGFRMKLTLTMDVPTLSVPLTGSGTAVVDQRDHAASMSFAIDLSQLPQAVQALGASTMQMSMIIERSVFYVKFPPALAARILAGKPWLKMDLAKLTGLHSLWSPANSPATSDPSHMLQYLRAESTDVTNEGRQVVGGRLTTHYHADIDLDQVASTVDPADRDALQRLLSQFEQATQTHQLPVDVWIDAHHLVRRMVMALRLPTSGGAMNETVAADLGDYGPQPPPSPPPADQVQDVSSLAAGASGLGAGPSGLNLGQ